MTMYEQSQQSDWLQTELESMSLQGVSPAKTFQSQEIGQEYKTERGAGYGQSAPVCSFGVHKENANTVGASGWQVEPSLGRVANGIPNQSHRLKCLGNAVVPPIPELIGRAINEANL